MAIGWLLSGGWRYAVMAVLVLMFGVEHLRRTGLETAMARAEKVATDEARKKDAEHAQLAAAIDQANLEKRDAIDKATDTARQLARTRGMYVRARCDLPGGPATPGGGQSGAATIRLPDEVADGLITFARDADRAAAYAQACHAWAMSIGRP